MNPCGKVVDLLRSCYRTQMRLKQGSDERTWVRWYFTRPGAPFLGRTCFGSLNWGYDRLHPPEVGEVAGAPRAWVNGAVPGRYTGRGQCGSGEAFLHGIPADAPPVIPPLHADGVPMCCATVPGGLRAWDWGRIHVGRGGAWVWRSVTE